MGILVLALELQQSCCRHHCIMFGGEREHDRRMVKIMEGPATAQATTSIRTFPIYLFFQV